MANSRLIKGGFFNHHKIASLSLKERYLLVGLMCTANDWGKFWAATGNIRSQVFPTDDIGFDEIDRMLENLQQLRFICIYEIEDNIYGHFPEWRTRGSLVFQKLDHPRDDTEIPDCPTHGGIEEGSKITRNFDESSRTIEGKRKENNFETGESEFNRNPITSVDLDAITEDVLNVVDGRRRSDNLE